MTADEQANLSWEIGRSLVEYIRSTHPDQPVPIVLLALQTASIQLLQSLSTLCGKERTEAECVEDLEGIVAHIKAGFQSGQVLPPPAKA